MSVAGLRPGFGRGGTIHSLLVREIGGEAAPGDETADGGGGFMHSDGGLWILVFAVAGAGVELDAEAISPLVRGEVIY